MRVCTIPEPGPTCASSGAPFANKGVCDKLLPTLLSHAGAWLTFRLWITCGEDQGQSRGKEDPIMNNYEVIVIVHPDLDENALNGVVDRVKGWITDAGGAIEKVDLWGRRRMAYSIKKQREGQYVYLQAQMKPTYTSELDRSLRFLEPVMRYSIIAVD